MLVCSEKGKEKKKMGESFLKIAFTHIWLLIRDLSFR